MKHTKVWAHRGASGYAPENSMEAFLMAIEMKADGIELDVQLTKDGEMVVIHDEWINRVSNGIGWVKDYTLEELREFNFNMAHPDYEYVTIPTLEEVYNALRPTNLTINVELKTGVIFYEGIEEKVLNLTKKMNMEERICYSSFNHYSIMKIKELNTEAKTGFLYMDGFINVPEYGKRMGVNALHPDIKNLQYPAFLENCKRYDLQLHVWTVNNETVIEKMCEMGIDAIITDYPDRARKIIDKIFI